MDFSHIGISFQGYSIRVFYLLIMATGYFCDVHHEVKWSEAPKNASEPNFYANQESADVRLMRRIKPDYGTLVAVRPVKNTSNPIVLDTYAQATQIISIDERAQTINLAMWLVLDWQNDFIRWDPKDYGGLREITIPASMVWLPDIGLSNSVEAQYDFGETSQHSRVRVDLNGRVHWYPASVMKFACNFDMTYFPFDSQFCSLIFGSLTHKKPALDFNIVLDHVDTGGYIENGAWSLIKAPLTKTIKNYAVDPNDKTKIYSELQINLHLKRKASFFVMNIIVPCIMISVLVILVFCLPAEAGEKVSLGITILLAFSVFQLLIAEIMPRTSDTQPLLVLYISSLMFLSMMSILISVIVLNLHHFQGIERPPKCLRLLVFKILATMVFARNRIPRREKSKVEPEANENHKNLKLSSTDSDNNDKQGVKSDVKEILNYIRNFRDTERDLRNEEEFALKEWTAMAIIVDRFFMLITLIATVLSTTTCLCFLVFS